MCYGQTGAGKTHTMTGFAESYANRGIVPRALQHLYQEINARPDFSYSVRSVFLPLNRSISSPVLLLQHRLLGDLQRSTVRSSSDVEFTLGSGETSSADDRRRSECCLCQRLDLSFGEQRRRRSESSVRRRNEPLDRSTRLEQTIVPFTLYFYRHHRVPLVTLLGRQIHGVEIKSRRFSRKRTFSEDERKTSRIRPIEIFFSRF